MGELSPSCRGLDTRRPTVHLYVRSLEKYLGLGQGRSLSLIFDPTQNRRSKSRENFRRSPTKTVDLRLILLADLKSRLIPCYSPLEPVGLLLAVASAVCCLQASSPKWTLLRGTFISAYNHSLSQISHEDVVSVLSLSTFRHRLGTFLFQRSYLDLVIWQNIWHHSGPWSDFRFMLLGHSKNYWTELTAKGKREMGFSQATRGKLHLSPRWRLFYHVRTCVPVL